MCQNWVVVALPVLSILSLESEPLSISHPTLPYSSLLPVKQLDKNDMEVDMLKEMFPQFDGAVVEAVYDSVGRDIETASTLLLAPSFDPSFYSQMPEPVVSYPKEPERRKKRPFEAYWTVCKKPTPSVKQKLAILAFNAPHRALLH